MRNRYLSIFVFVVLLVTLKTSVAINHLSVVSSEVVKSELKLVGSARFSVLFWDIYDSALFSQSGQYDNTQPYLLEITYLRDITSSELIERTVEQWQYLAIDENQYKPFVEPLQALWPDIKEGDQLAIWVTENGSTFYFNQEWIGEIQAQGFGNMFSSIWLSPDTSQPSLRKKLLGLNK